jgi:hypothetical protein
MFQEKTIEFDRAPIVPTSGQQLAPNEQLAPIEILSTAKRSALIACVKGGGTLHKRHGAWGSEAAGADDKPVAGMTVADLSRDGMLTLTALGTNRIRGRIMSRYNASAVGNGGGMSGLHDLEGV